MYGRQLNTISIECLALANISQRLFDVFGGPGYALLFSPSEGRSHHYPKAVNSTMVPRIAVFLTIAAISGMAETVPSRDGNIEYNCPSRQTIDTAYYGYCELANRFRTLQMTDYRPIPEQHECTADRPSQHHVVPEWSTRRLCPCI